MAKHGGLVRQSFDVLFIVSLGKILNKAIDRPMKWDTLRSVWRHTDDNYDDIS